MTSFTGNSASYDEADDGKNGSDTNVQHDYSSNVGSEDGVVKWKYDVDDTGSMNYLTNAMCDSVRSELLPPEGMSLHAFMHACVHLHISVRLFISVTTLVYLVYLM